MPTLKVTKKDVGKRADVFLAAKLPKFTRSSLEGLFDKGLVEVNAKTIKAGYKLKVGDELKAETRILTAKPPKIDIPIIYEDKETIVLNKPAGILTHSKGALNTEATVASFIKPKLTDKRLVGNRAGIVHRLDRGTSGVIITAKNEPAHKWLQKQFSTRRARKVYVAAVEGIPEPKEAIIDAAIERNPKNPQTFRVGINGKPAQTKYRVLKILNKSSILELEPKTGRTHQLRVHLKYIGHPIVGDKVYGHGNGEILLHAKSLDIALPGGKLKHFEAPIPKAFKDFENESAR